MKDLNVTVEYDHDFPHQPIRVTYNPEQGRTREEAEALAEVIRRALQFHEALKLHTLMGSRFEREMPFPEEKAVEPRTDEYGPNPGDLGDLGPFEQYVRPEEPVSLTTDAELRKAEPPVMKPIKSLKPLDLDWGHFPGDA